MVINLICPRGHKYQILVGQAPAALWKPAATSPTDKNCPACGEPGEEVLDEFGEAQ